MRTQGMITVGLIVGFIYCGYYARWFDIIQTWGWDTWAIVLYVTGAAFMSHNEFFGGHK